MVRINPLPDQYRNRFNYLFIAEHLPRSCARGQENTRYMAVRKQEELYPGGFDSSAGHPCIAENRRQALRAARLRLKQGTRKALAEGKGE